jgi:bla regulator protein BlaR1
MLSGQSPFLEALGWAVLNSFWQMALLWLCCQTIGRFPFSMSPARKAALATAGLLTGFAWFLYTLLNAWLSDGGFDLIIPTSYSWQIQEWLQLLLPYASFVYLFLLIFPIRHFIRNFRYVSWVRQQGISKIAVEWRLFTRNTAERMGIRKPVRIWLSELVSSPVTIGYLKPVILIPVAAVNQLSPAMMEAVILHELSHIRRYDYLLNLITRFIRTVLYFNPFVTAFQQIIEKEREKDCDDIVLQFRYDATGYATALLLLEQSGRKTMPLLLPVTGQGHELLHRIERILGVSGHAPLINYRRMAGVVAGLICLLGLNIALRLTVTATGNKGLTRFASSFPTSFTGAGPVAVSNHLPQSVSGTQQDIKVRKPGSENAIASASYPDIPGLIRVSALQTIRPELAHAQEEQVTKALDESRKVLESLQWKAAEKKMADVFTQQEKTLLKQKYLEKVSQFNWNKWEDKLKTAYNQVDWDRINSQLDVAMNHIRIDSLQSVYNLAASKLDQARSIMMENHTDGIPDTDNGTQ